MQCPVCNMPMYIDTWSGWRWCCAFCDYIGREATYEESDKQENEFEKMKDNKLKKEDMLFGKDCKTCGFGVESEICKTCQDLEGNLTNWKPQKGEIDIMPKYERGKVLKAALDIINGERQDMYGNPENSFPIIASYWRTYLESKGMTGYMLTAKDTMAMMVLFKLAREANQYNPDNIRDASGYLGLYDDAANLKK